MAHEDRFERVDDTQLFLLCILHLSDGTRVYLAKDGRHDFGEHAVAEVGLYDDLVDLPELCELRHLSEGKVAVSLGKASHVHKE